MTTIKIIMELTTLAQGGMFWREWPTAPGGDDLCATAWAIRTAHEMEKYNKYAVLFQLVKTMSRDKKYHAAGL